MSGIHWGPHTDRKRQGGGALWHVVSMLLADSYDVYIETLPATYVGWWRKSNDMEGCIEPLIACITAYQILTAAVHRY